MPVRLLWLLFVVVCHIGSLSAQQFSIEGEWEGVKSGRVELALYESVHPRILSARLRGGLFHITGTVDGPVAAELRSSRLSRPLVFFVEPGTIRLSVNTDNPEVSRVTGSRSNSQFRVLEQQWDERPDYTSPYAPLVVLRRGESAAMAAQFARLQGAALQTPHYQILQRQVEKLQASREGARLPHFVLTDTLHRSRPVDSLLSNSLYNVLLFSASYCRNCRQAEQMLDSLCHAGLPLHVVVSRIDDDPAHWDAAALTVLSVDHIPFLFVVHPDGTILHRDPAVWQLERLLPRVVVPSRHNP